MDSVDEEDLPSIIIGINFEKAWESLQWSFVERTLSLFNFGPSIIKWVQTLYKDNNSCVLNNWWVSQSFRLQRGLGQGCPLSPYLFILTAEVLSCFIRKNNDTKGITIDGVTHKICQYADDTVLFVPFVQDSINSSLLAFEEFQSMSGISNRLYKTYHFTIVHLQGNKSPLDHCFPWHRCSCKPKTTCLLLPNLKKLLKYGLPEIWLFIVKPQSWTPIYNHS